MVAATSALLSVSGLVGGIAVGIVAVWLARQAPPRMDPPLVAKLHATVWWVAAVAVATVFGWFAAAAAGDWALLPGYLTFGATTLAVSLTDLDHQLIPNRILFPGIIIGAVLLGGGALIAGTGGSLVRAGIGAVAYFVFLLIVAVVARGGFGMGDVKLAFLLGLFLGYAGWDALLVGFILAILLGGVASVLVLLVTKKGRKAKFAYGPYLVIGAWIGLFWGSRIADWYLGSGG